MCALKKKRVWIFYLAGRSKSTVQSAGEQLLTLSDLLLAYFVAHIDNF